MESSASARMSPATRLFLAGNTVSMLGTGLVVAFTLIYLHQVRGVALPAVGGLLAAAGGAGLLVVPLAGILLDRIGARRVLTGILVGQAAAQVLLAWAHNAVTALPVLLLYGATWSPMFPALQTMIAGLNPEPETQRRAFAINFTTQNAALGLGSTVGAIVASVHHTGTFQALFLANAATCLLFAVALPFLPSLHRPRGADEPRVGYRDVLASRELRLMLVASLLIYFTGYPAFEPGLPAYATVEAHVSAHIVALSVTVNTAFIVATQLLVLRLVRRLRRSRALALVGLIWAASWVVFGLAALPIPLASRVAFVFTFTALFGLGETFVAPTLGPLLNTLAADRVRGRANSLSALAQSLSFTVSPAIATGLIAAGAATVWISLLCVGCLGTVAIGTRLSRTPTIRQDRANAPPAAAPARLSATGPGRVAAAAANAWPGPAPRWTTRHGQSLENRKGAP